MPALYLALLVSAVTAGDTEILDRAEGKWELHPESREADSEFRCDATSLVISIDKASMRYTATLGEYTDKADILSVERDHFWLRYDNEERLAPDGRPVEWAWFSTGDDEFVWVRRDWLTSNPGASTAPRIRCQAPVPSV